MENMPLTPGPNTLTEEQKIEREFDQAKRNCRIARSRAAVVRSQIVRAYEELECIRFDHVGDTAFRDCITKAKSNLEWALGDFLMDDTYWKNRKEIFNRMTALEYHKGQEPLPCDQVAKRE